LPAGRCPVGPRHQPVAGAGSALIVGALGLLAAWLVMVQKIKGRGWMRCR
jgi:hypothetical protein